MWPKRTIFWIGGTLLCMALCCGAVLAAGPYHGNLQSKIFHSPSCRYYDCAKCTLAFETREMAVSAGYRPCKVCNP